MEVDRTNVEVNSSEAGGSKNLTIEDLADDYFSSVSSIARKLITEKQKRKGNLRKNWGSLSQAEKDNQINDWFIDEGIRLRYEIRMQGGSSMVATESIFQNYPKLKVPSGAKMVQYSESDQANEVITWRDEFSAPFSWDTKCQQNLGLFGEEVASPPDASESNLNTSQVSSDLDSSDLFSRVKDKTNRLSSGDINIHVNPTFNLAESGSASQVINRREPQPVVTQPRATQKLTTDQNSKPVVSSALPVQKPSQPPPVAPGTVTTRTTLTSNRISQSSISSRSSYSSTSSRPSQPPPSIPPGMPKPSQPAPPAASRRPADMPPLPPQKPKVQSPKATERPPTKTVSPQPSLSKSSDRGMKETLFSQTLDEIDFRLDLDKPTTLTNNTDESTTAVAPDDHESEEDEKVDTHKDAAFDFLLQW